MSDDQQAPYLRGLQAALAVSGGARRAVRPLGSFLLIAVLYGAHSTGADAAAMEGHAQAAAGALQAATAALAQLPAWERALLALGHRAPGCSPWGPPAPPAVNAGELARLCALLDPVLASPLEGALT